MSHWLLLYTLSPDYLARRPAWRDAHLALARAAAQRGDLLLGGALDPADEALLLFAAEGAAERFAAADPYVREGLVTAWTVRRWITVAGPLAATPVGPAG